METELRKAWQEGLYWIAMKYDLDPLDDEVINLFEEIYESGWVDAEASVKVYDE